MFDKLKAWIPRILIDSPILKATKNIPHPNPRLRKRGWWQCKIYNNPHVEGSFDYKGQKRGRVSLTFYDERGMPISRWNTHKRQNIRVLHRDNLVTNAKDLPFKKSPTNFSLILRKT